jgi:hypothetical protein
VGRFDPLSGRFRLRYAANLAAVAARERFAARTITEADGDLFLVRLTSSGSVVSLTRQSNLDVLGLDDRINTGRLDPAGRDDPDPLLETCGALSDAVFDWWDGEPPPIEYRSRTMGSVGRNIAFGQWSDLPAQAVGRLRDATALLVHLVLHAGFTVPESWISE